MAINRVVVIVVGVVVVWCLGLGRYGRGPA